MAGIPGGFTKSGPFNGSVLTGAGPGGGPHVRVFGSNGIGSIEFFAFDPSFRGGVSVAYNPGHLQDLNNSPYITAPMSNGVPVVQFHDVTGKPTTSFFAYDQRFQGGVNLAVKPLGSNGHYVLFTGA